MRWRDIIAAVIAFISLAAALETFGKVSLIWKLITLTLSTIIVLYLLVISLTKLLDPKIEPGFKKPTPSGPFKRYVLPAFALTMICVIFVIGARIIVNFYTIGIEEMESPNSKLSFWIRGAVPLAKKVSVQLPTRAKTLCTIKDSPKNRADSLMVDWNSKNPQLQLSSFSYPQSISVHCSPRIDFSSINIQIEPPTTLVLWPEDREIYKKFIIVIGGILCIATLLIFFVRSR